MFGPPGRAADSTAAIARQSRASSGAWLPSRRRTPRRRAILRARPAADAPVRLNVLHLRQDRCVCRWSGYGSGGGRWRSNLDQSDFRSIGTGLGVRNACPEKMLAGGNGNRLGDGGCRVICLVYGLTVKTNGPLCNGIAGVCGCIHRDVAGIHTGCGALQPDAADRAILVVISRFRSAASRTAVARIPAEY